MDFDKLLHDAEKGGFQLWKLNFMILRGIPFNRPHGLKILKIDSTEAQVKLPFWRINQNHIRGMHACALATLSEYTTGLVLLKKLGSSKYRLIMKSMKMEYFYQAKMDAIAKYSISDAQLSEIHSRLETEEKYLLVAEVKVHDVQGNHLCTGFIEWQLKPWNSVKMAKA